MNLRSLVLCACAMACASDVHAQTDTATVSVEIPHEDAHARPAQVVAGAIIGSGVGAAVGLFAGAGLGLGGGDDPGLGGAILGAGVGSVIGTGLGIRIASGGEVPFGTSLAASAAGILAGVAGMYAVGEITDGRLDETGAWIGYSFGQGLSAGLISAWSTAASRPSATAR